MFEAKPGTAMIKLHLTPADVENIRFAFSPLIELSASFQVLQDSHPLPFHQAWVDETRRQFEGIDFPYMRAAILPHSYIVDFLSPTPAKSTVSFGDEIERLRQTPDEVIRRNIQQAIALEGMTPVRRIFLEHPREALECLIEELTFYWQQALEPYWTQLATILDSDVQFRARTLALSGIDAMFMGLADKVDYQNSTLQIHGEEACNANESFELKGDGIRLVPSIFASCGSAWQVVPEYLPMLIYPTRGLGLWRHNNAAEANDALAITLGASRARLLQALAEPAHTLELAQRLDITPGAVSQQLGRLSSAGLLDSYRSGSKVYYRLSSRGERLLNVFAN
jgi:DNA-binding transcriptional ArsR family regulator